MGYLSHAGTVEGSGNRTVEVRAESHVIRPDDFNGVVDGPGDGFRVLSADRFFPIADADDATLRRDRFELGVAEVAVVVAGSFDARVGDEDRPGGDGEDLFHGFCRRVGEIDEDAPPLEFRDHRSAEGGEAALVGAVSGARHFVVEEVGEADEAEARLIEGVDVFDFSFEGMEPFDGEQSADEFCVRLAGRQKIGEVLIQTGMIAPGVVDESLRLQEMVSSGELSGLQAADILRQANARKVGIDVIMEERASRKEEVEKINSVLEVILQSGALSGENFNRAQSLARQLNVSIAEVILTKEMVEKRLIMAAYQGQSLVNDGIINGAQCVLAMKMCVKTGKEFHEVLKELPSDTAESSPPADDSAGGDKKSGWLGSLWSKVTKKD